jgi:epoxyqueuosine reductase
MKEAIRAQALALGFDDCRFTSAQPPATLPHFARWLEAGWHGTMTYLARGLAKRAELARVLEGVQSVIVLAASYAGEGPDDAAPRPPGAPQRAAGTVGRIARYARYADYHTVLAGPLQQLCDLLETLGGAGTRSRWYADTGPILERDLAERAGLGFIGKHTNLIRPRGGNWFLLAEILTTLPLAPDPPERNRCGSCARCLAACPTGAIRAPFLVDARLCLSYLTIELRGPIPVELRSALGPRIFGCDDCLAACPWNRFARAGALLQAHRRADLDQPELLDLLELDEAEFRRRYAETPLRRGQRLALIRNVCVALGNVGDRGALKALERCAQGPDAMLAEHARWAMGQIEARQAAPAGNDTATAVQG